MIKKKSRIQLLITFILLSIILISIVGSFFLFKEVDNLQVEHDKVEQILYMRQYEYELMRTATAFSEAYPTALLTSSRDHFENWFNVLWSRAFSLDKGTIGKYINKSGFDHLQVQKQLKEIDHVLFQNSEHTKKDYANIREIFISLVNKSHVYQQQRNSLYREIELKKQQALYKSYQNSVFLSFIALLLGLAVFIFLYTNNQKLMQMQLLLEEKVNKRTKALQNKNLQLKNEVSERYLIEEKLLNSKKIIERAKEDALNQLNYDALTKLASRDLFSERFYHALKIARSSNTKIALLFLDLDRFKYINDTLGHSVGDDLLKQCAQRIRESLKQTDTAARFGGDEFAILLPSITNLSQIESVAARILKKLSSPYNLSGHQSFISASIGISLYPDDGNNTEALLRKADSAMYKAKEKGRNTFQFFTQQMETDLNNQRVMEAALHLALQNDEFTVHYQPIIEASSGKICSAEALIRWTNNQGDSISPCTFIPLAEELGHIIEIGKWVLKTACKQAVLWQQDHGQKISVSVNLSYRQFQNNDIALIVGDILVETGLEPEYLFLEITEGTLMVDENRTKNQLQAIRELGVALSIDDFGTGYSSLSYLKKFPIDILKIDQSFIKDVMLDNSNAELVKGILSLAKSLNLKVIAEGVEKQQQAVFLEQNGCLLLQGYLFSKPLCSSDFIKMISQSQ